MDVKMGSHETNATTRTDDSLIECDVIVLGGGLSSGAICAILAKEGLSTVMVDNGCHPRFSIGEALVPESSFMFRMLAKRFDIPELDAFSSIYKIVEEVGTTCGVKRALSTIYHNLDGSYDVVQIPAISPPLGPDAHLFRQDTDAFICNVAAEYGARVLHNTQIESIDITEMGVTLMLGNGKILKGKFIVDAGGQNSSLANHFNARIPGDYKTTSRAIFTHMVDVEFIDNLIPEHVGKTYDFLISQCTLHHVFDGGWIWVIPFNNHPRATNPIVSVGLVLDCNKYPYAGKNPEAEFWEFANRFDLVKQQLRNAQTVRPWVGSKGPMQYSSNVDPVTYRAALVGPAHSFVDPLFSPGINTTLGFIFGLMPKIINSVKCDDYSVAAYEGLNQDYISTGRMWDRMIHGSYIAFRNTDLWDAWFKFWNVFGFTGNVLITNLMLQYEASGDKRILDQKMKAPYNGPFSSKLPPAAEMFEKGYALILSVESGDMTPEMAVDKLFGLMNEQTFFPFPEFYKRDPIRRSLPTNTLYDLLRQIYIYRKKLPTELKPYLAGYSVRKSLFWATKELARYPLGRFSAVGIFLKDIFVSDRRFAKQRANLRAKRKLMR